MPDAPPGLASVTVLTAGEPDPGVVVVVQDNSGAVVSTETTNASGVASLFVSDGDQVTAALGTAAQPSLVTLQKVEPGDAITLVNVAEANPPLPHDVSITLPAPSWDASGTYEVAQVGQCQTVLPAELYLEANCQARGVFPLLALAEGPGGEVAYTYQTNNAVIPDGGLADGGVLPLVVSRPWSTSTAAQTVTVTQLQSLPGAGTALEQSKLVLQYTELANGVPSSFTSASPTTIDSGVEGVFAMHPGYPDSVESTASQTLRATGGSVSSVLAAAMQSAPESTSQSVSFDLSTLPAITASSIDVADAGTPSRPVVTWTSTSSLSAAAGVFVSIQWSSTSADDAGTSVTGTWTLLAPSTATSVSAPALPALLAAWSPSAGASFQAAPRVAAIQASFLSGYSALRGELGVLPFFVGDNAALTVPPLPVNGTLFVSGLYPGAAP